MLRIITGIAVGWMLFDEKGKEFADKAGNKIKNISKDTLLKAKDAIENIQEVKDFIAEFSNSPEIVDAINPATVPAIISVDEAAAIDGAVIAEQTNTQN